MTWLIIYGVGAIVTLASLFLTELETMLSPTPFEAIAIIGEVFLWPITLPAFIVRRYLRIRDERRRGR